MAGVVELERLAMDLRWSWNHSADALWNELDSGLWASTHNPWVLLQTISKSRLEEALQSEKVQNLLNILIEKEKEREEEKTWFEESHPDALNCIAYFSMEFMLSEALPIYSGGLGNVAGDQLKAASDLGVPVVGIGLLYSQGYFRQIIDLEGHQEALYPYNEPGQLPIKPLRRENGEWLRIDVNLPGCCVWLRAWEAKVGKTKLFLLDTNDAANYPAHRGITNELYGGDKEMRIKQEIVLGIGGWKLIQALDLKPQVCHLNEGHAAFAILERARSLMKESNLNFQEAMTATRPGNLFTTHTAAPAGFDIFSRDLMEHYFKHYAEEGLKISFDDFMALDGTEPLEDFNMAHLAIRGSGFVNGVSKLHGKVSRQLFEPLFPNWPEVEIPIGSVTNGVHVPSWDSMEADDLWTKTCGKGRWLGTMEELQDKIRQIPDDAIWNVRNAERKRLVEFARNKLLYQLQERGFAEEELEKAKNHLSPDALTLGFARRFAGYKRPNLLLHDPDRLLKILTNQEKPAQLILAGKAHPEDKEGEELIRRWMEFIYSSDEARSHVVFLSDYDMLLTEELVQGTDVWINTPRRPWEACGTSGMKILVNGGLNVSELDGWWAEGYCPEVGWAIGDGKEHGDDPEWDKEEANSLYDLIENQIIPEFYNRNELGMPTSWLGKIRESLARLTPHFSANRSVREYTETYYIPAADAFRKRTENNAQLAKEIASFKQKIAQNWEKVAFGQILQDTIEIFLGDLIPDEVKVELFANEEPPKVLTMKTKTATGYLYTGFDPSPKYTARIIPHHDALSIPLELSNIRWQK